MSMLAPQGGEKTVPQIKPALFDLVSAASRKMPLAQLLAQARRSAGLAHYDANLRYLSSTQPYLNWPGKAQAWAQALSAPQGKLQADESYDPTSPNLYLEGDNLEVLKLLLPHLQGQVQIIYADPPYNTGKDFVYADNFVLSPSAYERLTAAQAPDKSTDKANGANGTGDNGTSGSAGRLHAQWCSFIYPRLLLARELMADDAVIFLSIDDHECHNLKLILDEVFGAQNFISQLVWQRAFAAKNDAKTVPVSHDYVLMFAKDKAYWERSHRAAQHALRRQLLRRTLVGDSQEGTQELKRLLNSGVFDGPKPVRLIKYLLELADLAPHGLVLDFFAGSATTGQAVLELNATDGGARRFILIQAPEPCAPASPARKAGFSDIAQIGRARLDALNHKLAQAAPVYNNTSNKKAMGRGTPQNIFASGCKPAPIMVARLVAAASPAVPSLSPGERYELCAHPGTADAALPLTPPVQMAYWALTSAGVALKDLSALAMCLAPTGVCYLHCPDAHVLAAARILADEALGANNFIATLVDASQAQPQNAKAQGSQLETPREQLSFILMYARSRGDFKLGRLPRTAAANGRYRNRDNDPRGPWTSGDLSVKTYNAECDYPIVTPSGHVVHPPKGLCWRLNQASLARAINDNRIWFGVSGNNCPRLKRFLSELKHEGMVPLSLILPESLQPVASLQLEQSRELSLAVRLIHMANLDQAPKPRCLLLGAHDRCQSMAQALELKLVSTQQPPELIVGGA